MSRRFAVWLALLLLTLAIYGRSFRYGFVRYDDDALFSEQVVPHSFFGAEGKRLWTTSVFGNWQPIVTLTVVADRHLHGLNPRWMHAENALLHALCGIAVFEFLRRATQRFGPSAVVAAWFICAPMHVESVAWLSERKDVMAALFFFLSLAAYCDFARRRTVFAYSLSVVWAALSLMCKPMAVTVAAVMLLIDYWPLSRLERFAVWPQRLLEKLPFVLLALGSAAIAVVTQSSWGQLAGTAVALPVSDRVGNAIVCYLLYAWKLLVPINLAVFYPHPGHWPAAAVIAAGAVLAAVSWTVFRDRGKRPFLLVGWLWFLGTLVPVIGFFQIGAQAMADRYSYIPSVGLFVAIVWGVDRSLIKARGRNAALIVASAMIAVYSILAFVQVGCWVDTDTLFLHAIDATGDNWEADAELGEVAFERRDLASAAGYFTEVIRLAPGSPKGYAGLAGCIDDPRRQATLLRSAVDRSPRSTSYRLRLARSLVESGDENGALAEAKVAARLDAASADAKAAVAALSAHKPAN